MSVRPIPYHYFTLNQHEREIDTMSFIKVLPVRILQSTQSSAFDVKYTILSAVSQIEGLEMAVGFFLFFF